MQQDYTAKQGARIMLAGLIIVIACFLETICRTVEGLTVAIWQNKWQIALCIAAAALCAVLPYVIAGVAYLVVMG